MFPVCGLEETVGSNQVPTKSPEMSETKVSSMRLTGVINKDDDSVQGGHVIFPGKLKWVVMGIYRRTLKFLYSMHRQT